MGESLGVSVSFGKYESDALSWEKWSTFSSPNKYLEEVGKCSTPGSVAQKKAFFEAHYKKIAAMKAEAELLDQEKAAEAQHSRLDDLTEENLQEIACPSRSDDFTEEVEEEYKRGVESKVFCNDEEVQPEISVIEGSGKHHGDEPSSEQSQRAEDATSVNDESFQDEFVQVGSNQDVLPAVLNSNAVKLEEATAVNTMEPQQLLPIASNSNLGKLEEAVLVNHESMKLVKQHFQVDSMTEDAQESKQDIPKPKAQNMTRKVNPTKVEKNSVGTKKKPASIIPKSPETSAIRLSKPKPKATPTPVPSVKSSSKKTISSTTTSSKNKIHSVSESRRIAPISLHLSMSMHSVNSDTASSVTSSRRRSLFMEQMGDKDIVKRAFKTFQNRVNQLPSSDVTSTGPKQLPTKGSEPKASTSMASQKENERSRKAAEKIKPTRGQLGPTWKSVSSMSLKGVGVDERRPKATPTSIVLRSNERAERRKEFFKNLEEKSNAREAERTQLSERSKEIKDAEMKKLRQNLTFKAKPMPSFYQTQGASKTTSEKSFCALERNLGKSEQERYSVKEGFQ
ncbi:WVD2-like protein 7 isoform X1 [Tanacetum coccineum]